MFLEQNNIHSVGGYISHLPTEVFPLGLEANFSLSAFPAICFYANFQFAGKKKKMSGNILNLGGEGEVCFYQKYNKVQQKQTYSSK